MIDVDALRGEITKNRMSQADVAKEIGISAKTFYKKMDKGVFGSDEIEMMIKILKISDPCSIFFADEVTYKVTNEPKS